MSTKTLGRNNPEIAVVWDGTNLDEIKEFVGSDYNVYLNDCVTLIIENNQKHLEALIGWYIILEEYINDLSQIDYKITCASPETMSCIYDIIE